VIKHEIAVRHQIQEKRNTVQHDLHRKRVRFEQTSKKKKKAKKKKIKGSQDRIKVMRPKVVSDVAEHSDPDVGCNKIPLSPVKVSIFLEREKNGPKNIRKGDK
jgi:hypothetical protein